MSSGYVPETQMNADMKINADDTGFAGHPRGLMTLFFTEMWERFSFYGMRAILVLYMTASVANGGLEYSPAKAGLIYGLYTWAVYMMSLPGGWVGDKFLGARGSVIVGGSVIALGHFSMALPGITFFYAGLGMIVMGTGMLKPNISAMVGNLYRPGDTRRDGGFSIFYMGINIGAFISPLVCGYLAQQESFKTFLASNGFTPSSSWHWGFAAAGVGMVLGLSQYILGFKRLPKGAPQAQSVKVEETVTAQVPVMSRAEEYKRIQVIVILLSFALFFWATFEQAGSSLSLFAEQLTDNTFLGYKYPSSWLQSVNSMFVIALAPVFSIIWVKLGERQPNSSAKFALGLFFAGLGLLTMMAASLFVGDPSTGAVTKVSPMWLITTYFFFTVGELCLSPVGLSTVTKLAPARIVGFMLGAWFLSTAFGNLLAGLAATFFDPKALVTLFATLALVSIIMAATLAALTPMVKRMTGRE
jgi:proton-dependent oligopeptide transporter, POT family